MPAERVGDLWLFVVRKRGKEKERGQPQYDLRCARDRRLRVAVTVPRKIETAETAMTQELCWPFGLRQPGKRARGGCLKKVDSRGGYHSSRGDPRLSVLVSVK